MSLLSLPPLFLAQVGPDDHPYLVYVVIGGAFALAALFNHITGGMVNLRRLKNANAQEGRDYATQLQLREVHGRVDALTLDQGKLRGEMLTAIHGMGDQVSAALRGVSEQMNGVQRSLGRVESLEILLKEHGADIDQLQGRKTR